ncbi:hypothetical protein Tco_0154671 [Tanacetum coccineum]
MLSGLQTQHAEGLTSLNLFALAALTDVLLGSTFKKQNIGEGCGNVVSAIAKGLLALKVDVQCESILPSICDDVLAIEYVCTTSIYASGHQYSNVSIAIDVAVNAIGEECIFARESYSIVVDQHTPPPITNKISSETLNDRREEKFCKMMVVVVVNSAATRRRKEEMNFEDGWFSLHVWENGRIMVFEK